MTQRVAANNQVEVTLDAFWPGAKAIFADVTSKIALAFLERYPTPTSAAALGEKRLGAFCAKHGYSGRRSPQELLERLRAAPSGIADGAECTARKEIVLAFVHSYAPSTKASPTSTGPSQPG